MWKPAYEIRPYHEDANNFIRPQYLPICAPRMACYNTYKKEYSYLPKRYTKNGESRTEVTEDGLGLISLVETLGQGFHFKFQPIRAISAIAPNVEIQQLDWSVLDARNWLFFFLLIFATYFFLFYAQYWYVLPYEFAGKSIATKT